MVKLTIDLVEGAMQYTNPLRDRELDLRGYKVPAIENLGSTLDQFDTIDFTDNEIRKLDGFPLLQRLKSLIMTGNKVLCCDCFNLDEKNRLGRCFEAPKSLSDLFNPLANSKFCLCYIPSPFCLILDYSNWGGSCVVNTQLGNANSY